MRKIVTMFVMMMMVLVVSCANESTDSDDGGSSSGGGKTPLTAADLTIAEADLTINADDIKALIETGSVETGLAVGAVTGLGDLIAGTPLKLSVADSTITTDAVVVFNQNLAPGGLVAMVSVGLDSIDETKYSVGAATGVVSGAGDNVLTITAPITAKGSYSVPANLKNFTIEITLAGGGAHQDKWTK